MKIAVVAANGKAGRLVVKEAQARGLEVTAIVRGTDESGAGKVIVKDALSLTRRDLEGFDAVVSAVGGWTAQTVGLIPAVTKHLIELLSGTDTRLLVVGGAGSLFVNAEHTLTVSDGPDFPAAWKPVSDAHGEALAALRASQGLAWTYLSPAADFRADAERTGEYILAGEDFTLNSRGESVISYADYAIAMVDEIVSGNHIGMRISVVGR